VRLTDTTPQEVVLALKTTGASDEDVLYAAKTEFAEPFRYQKVWGVCLGVIGVLISLTLFGAILGLPAAGFGIWMWRKGERNLAVVDSAFAQYRAGRPVPTACADYTTCSDYAAPPATATPHARRPDCTQPQPGSTGDRGRPERTA
jgi:hypothetical protein